MNWKNLVRAVVFTIVLLTVISAVTSPFTIIKGVTQRMDYKWMKGIYNEPKGSLDAIYIGSSNAYSYWNQNVAWKEYGITVYPYSCAEAPLTAYEYMLREAHRTHPDSVYILNINTLGESVISDHNVVLHRVADQMPMSLNKLRLINHMANIADMEYKDRLEFIFPIIKYHSGWDELGEYSFDTDTSEMKGGNTFGWYLDDTWDIAYAYKESDKTTPPEDYVMESVDGILEFCEKEDLKVLFVTAPRAETSVEHVEKINYINEYLEEKGYDVLNMMDIMDEYGVNLRLDFYNLTHTNIHGAIKYTSYMSEYLIEKYGFEDKRGQEEYSDWDEAWEAYSKVIDGKRVIPLEYDIEHRKYDINYPAKLTGKTADGKATISWQASQGADGYEIYCRNKYYYWKKIGETTDLSFTEKSRGDYKALAYRVIPYVEIDGERYYGQFQYRGVKVNGK